MVSNNQHATILFIGHGGGPLPLLGDPLHAPLIDFLGSISAEIPKPEAILVISAHWESAIAAVTAGKNPELIYDYSGFPPESYSIQYPATGNPVLADKVKFLFDKCKIPARLDPRRGFDHGLFVPLKLIYPDADIPCIQLSLLANLNADQHLALGEALQPLQKDNLLVLGSGFTFHNLKAFFAPLTNQQKALNLQFEDFLQRVLSDKSLSESERRNRMQNWIQAPGARFSQPREEHLLPLHVCYGMAGRAADKVYDIEINHTHSSCYLWSASDGMRPS